MSLEQEPEDNARRAVALERGRIARELHDVVAHSLSVMTVQAAGARRVLESDPARAVEAIGVIEKSGRDALLELRRLLALLGPEDSLRAEVEASPSLENLPVLLSQVSRAGVHAELHIEGLARPLPADVDLCAYRIVQEALTNVIKHVGECHVDVSVLYTDQALELEVLDHGSNSSSTPQSTGVGSGLAGMCQRAAHIGGKLEAGFHAEGYRIRARLPIAR